MSDKNKKVSAFAAYHCAATSKSVQKGTKNIQKQVAAKNGSKNVAAKNGNKNGTAKNGGKQKVSMQKCSSYSDADNGCSSETDSSSDEDEEEEEDENETSTSDSSSGAPADSSDDSESVGEEYTLNSHSSTSSSSQFSPATPAKRRESLKPRHAEESGKPIGAKRTSSTPVGQSTSAPAGQQQQPKATSCPLKRKSQPAVKETKIAAGKTADKSCPLPPKNKRLSQSPAAASSCPLPSKKNTVPVKEEVSSPIFAIPLSAKKEPVPSLPCSIQIGLIKPIQPGAGPSLAANCVDPIIQGHKENSIEEGKRAMGELIAPMTMATFLRDHWEKEAFRVSNISPGRFSDLISFDMIDQMLVQNHVEYTTNIDVTSYEGGVRKTLNPDGRALPPSVWAHYRRGCSIRILNPSSYLVELRKLCTKLQEFFHCLVGANVYLTPPESQGFAPHYDDIEAFVLQVEGKKRWRIYPPTKELPRESSGNLSQAELGKPIMDIVLKAGDFLYFPRGWIHQAITEKNSHSLHITLSAYQQQSYANLMEKLMPLVVKERVEQSLNLRKGLPLNIWQNLGLANGKLMGDQRKAMIQHIQHLAKRLVPTESQIDQALDQLALRFQHEALPPTIAPTEMLRTVYGVRNNADANGHCSDDYNFTEATAVRLLRANIVRLTGDEGVLRCYYYTDNGLEYCKYEPNFFELEPCQVTAIETLIHAYPQYTKIKNLPPMENDEDRLEFAEALWERGILMVEKPFRNHP